MQELPGSGEAYLMGAGEPFPKGDGLASCLFAGLSSDDGRADPTGRGPCDDVIAGRRLVEC